jgi:hypothetical protein
MTPRQLTNPARQPSVAYYLNIYKARGSGRRIKVKLSSVEASIDAEGRPNLTGLTEDRIDINEIKVAVADLRASLETPLRHNCITHVVALRSRDSKTANEGILIAYVPKYWPRRLRIWLRSEP